MIIVARPLRPVLFVVCRQLQLVPAVAASVKKKKKTSSAASVHVVKEKKTVGSLAIIGSAATGREMFIVVEDRSTRRPHATDGGNMARTVCRLV